MRLFGYVPERLAWRDETVKKQTKGAQAG